MARPLFDFAVYTTLAAETPASVVFISGMSLQLALAAVQIMEFIDNWTVNGNEPTTAEEDLIDAAVSQLVFELLTATGRSEDDSMGVQARYTGATAQTIAAAATGIVDFPTRDYDTHNAVTTGATWKFTAPVAGWYHISIHISFNPNVSWTAVSAVFGRLFRNGVTGPTLAAIAWQLVVGNVAMLAGGDTIYMNAGEYIDIRFVNGASGQCVLSLAATNTFISIAQVG